MSVEVESLIEILMEDPEKTCTNAEFAEWLEEQGEIQNAEHEWRDKPILRYEGKEDESDGD